MEKFFLGIKEMLFKEIYAIFNSRDYYPYEIHEDELREYIDEQVDFEFDGNKVLASVQHHDEYVSVSVNYSNIPETQKRNKFDEKNLLENHENKELIDKFFSMTKNYNFSSVHKYFLKNAYLILAKHKNKENLKCVKNELNNKICNFYLT